MTTSAVLTKDVQENHAASLAGVAERLRCQGRYRESEELEDAAAAQEELTAIRHRERTASNTANQLAPKQPGVQMSHETIDSVIIPTMENTLFIFERYRAAAAIYTWPR